MLRRKRPDTAINLPRTKAHVALIALLAMTSCTSEPVALPVPTTVDAAAAAQASGELTVKVGTIVNMNAPTAARDRRLADVLTTAAGLTTAGAAVTLEVMTIDGVEDVDSTVSTLAGRGVTVIASLCDDASVSQIIDAALEQGILAVTACVTLPKPDVTSTSPLFFDLANLAETPAAIVELARSFDAEGLSTVRSDLLPDVADSCGAVEEILADTELVLDASVTFTELVDEPSAVIEGATPTLVATDAIVLCALPPSANDMVVALRSAGFDQPVIVPWYADGETWSLSTSDVFVVAPASRYGDDPETAVVELVELVGESAESVDVVSADTIHLLAYAAKSAQSPGSRRLAETLSGLENIPVVSGDVVINEQGRVSRRDYRVIEIRSGSPEFAGLVTASQ